MTPVLAELLRCGPLRDPRRLPGIVGWFDGADAGSMTIDASNRVSNWANKAGVGTPDLAQGTVGSQPTYSANTRTMTFDGTDDYLKTSAFTLNQPLTVYLVASQTSWTNGDVIFDGNATGPQMFQNTSTPTVSLYAGSTGISSASWALGTRAVTCCVFNNASSSFRYNMGSATAGTLSTLASGGFTLGASFNGTAAAAVTINEVAIYNVAHSAASQQAFWRYASRKWVVSS